MAAAFPADPKDDEAGAADAELEAAAAQAESIEGLQQKVYNLKKFLSMVRSDMETAAALAGPKRDKLRNETQGLMDKYGWDSMLKNLGDDEVLQAALMAMMYMLKPDALQKEKEPFAAAEAFVQPKGKPEVWLNFQKSVRGLEAAVNEGRTEGKHEEWAHAKACAHHVEQNYKTCRWRVARELCLHLCEWVVAASGWYDLSSEMAVKKGQEGSMKKELAAAQKELDAALEKEDTKDGLSPMLVKQVLKATQEAGVLVGRAQVEWALNRVIGGSTAEPADAATKMILAQPAARRALAALRDPSTLAAFALDYNKTLTASMVKSARASLKQEGIKAVAEALAALSDAGDDDEGDDDEGGGEEEKSAAALVRNLSRAEGGLLRWALAVCDWHDKRRAAEPQEQRWLLMERKVQQKERDLDKKLSAERADVLERAHRQELPSELFPEKARGTTSRGTCTASLGRRRKRRSARRSASARRSGSRCCSTPPPSAGSRRRTRASTSRRSSSRSSCTPRARTSGARRRSRSTRARRGCSRPSARRRSTRRRGSTRRSTSSSRT